MLLNSELPTTSVLLIDGFNSDRRYFADQLKRCSLDYQIVEADRRGRRSDNSA
jgi:hypothetical protein